MLIQLPLASASGKRVLYFKSPKVELSAKHLQQDTMNMKSNLQYIISYFSLFTLLCILLPENAYSQENDSRGGFEVVKTVGCVPFTIQVIDQSDYDATEIRRYNFNFNNNFSAIDEQNRNNFPPGVEVHTYTEAGFYTIAQLVDLGGESAGFYKKIDVVRVYDPIPPQFRISVCKNNEIQLQITDTIYNKLTVDWGDGTSAVLDSAASANHVYASAGVKNVQVSGDFVDGGGTCGTRTETIQVVEILPRATILSASSDQDKTIKLNFSANNQIPYELQEKASGGVFQTIQQIEKGSSEISLTGKKCSGWIVLSNHCHRCLQQRANQLQRNLFSEKSYSLTKTQWQRNCMGKLCGK